MSQSTSTIISPAVATPERAYTVLDVAAALRITKTEVYRNLKQWEHLRFGTEIRFTEAQYQALLMTATRVPAGRKS
ncbi:hypothetical protein [Arthrobacter dokdonensis]|uniref:hypothetical protein n=1 Tax=Arthrobacter dokdonellae TaxID=2211210 RepID=UPI000DE5B51E|nr:hypothetical protein [Arthrobacter dokdonellae]